MVVREERKRQRVGSNVITGKYLNYPVYLSSVILSNVINGRGNIRNYSNYMIGQIVIVRIGINLTNYMNVRYI